MTQIDQSYKIPDTIGIVGLDYNVKIGEIIKILRVSGLATTSALTAIENKIPNVISWVKKADYNTNIGEIENKVADHSHDKYITTPEFNKFTAEVIGAGLARANLVT